MDPLRPNQGQACRSERRHCCISKWGANGNFIRRQSGGKVLIPVKQPAGGLRSAQKAKAENRYVSAETVLAKLEQKLAAAKQPTDCTGRASGN
ncbi:hypothetical protein [Polaromonas sp.]|uniref:hypothetical protein n=1 Tax=Polaromonas sp. TaxID=1869339 RepID=UPI002FCAAB36